MHIFITLVKKVVNLNLHLRHKEMLESQKETRSFFTLRFDFVSQCETILVFFRSNF